VRNPLTVSNRIEGRFAFASIVPATTAFAIKALAVSTKFSFVASPRSFPDSVAYLFTDYWSYYYSGLLKFASVWSEVKTRGAYGNVVRSFHNFFCDFLFLLYLPWRLIGDFDCAFTLTKRNLRNNCVNQLKVFWLAGHDDLSSPTNSSFDALSAVGHAITLTVNTV